MQSSVAGVTIIYSFDTSAINALLDDPDCESVEKRLLSTGQVGITALNVIEACGTEDAARRADLLDLERRLAAGYLPWAVPIDLLKVATAAYWKQQGSMNISIGPDLEGLWITLNEPSRLEEGQRQEIFSWKESREGPFKEIHRAARPKFQDLFHAGVAVRPTSFEALLCDFMKEDFLMAVVSPLYLQITGEILTTQELRRLLADVPHWTLYLGGWAYSTYERAIRESDYGVKGKAGTIDLWCAVYLPHCDCFVTNDNAQREALLGLVP